MHHGFTPIRTDRFNEILVRSYHFRPVMGQTATIENPESSSECVGHD